MASGCVVKPIEPTLHSAIPGGEMDRQKFTGSKTSFTSLQNTDVDAHQLIVVTPMHM
jgi:hypothetical protein